MRIKFAFEILVPVSVASAQIVLLGNLLNHELEMNAKFFYVPIGNNISVLKSAMPVSNHV